MRTRRGGAYARPVFPNPRQARRRVLRHGAPAAFVLALAVWALAPWHPQAIFYGGPPLALALFWVTALHSFRTAGVAFGTCLAGAVSTGLPTFTHAGAVVPFALLFTVAWAVGLAVGQRRRYLHALLRQERDRADREAAAERLRLARDMHDVIAHSISVISVQAAFGRLVAEHRPAEARGALETIETTGRETLAELRRMLGVLRDDSLAPELAPTPGLADLEQLAERTRRAGLRVDLAVTGEVEPMPPGLAAAAYRIVQEALTNVVKHAGATTARVTVGHGHDKLTVTVTDDGTARPAPQHDGRGLPGMRERVTLYAGTLEAGPSTSGGFRVHARFPLAPSPLPAPPPGRP